MLSEDHSDPHIYRIGAVSRLTSIPTGTIRVWERRYGVVEPGRSDGGFRLYSHRDVERLRVIKSLIEHGETIGGLASLELDQLRARLGAHGLKAPEPLADPLAPPSNGTLTDTPLNGNGLNGNGSTNGGAVGYLNGQGSTNVSTEVAAGADPVTRLRVVTVGESLALAMRLASTNFDRLQMVGDRPDWRGAEMDIASLRPDLIVLEQPSMHVETAEQLHRFARLTRTRHLLVVYQFGSEAALRALESEQITPVKGPLNATQLQLALKLATDRVRPSEEPERSRRFIETMDQRPPPARFDPETIARIAAQSRVVHCECPQHLATLISSLMAFEAYCRECEHRSDEDAALHAALERSTGQARSTLEDALEYLLQVENITP